MNNLCLLNKEQPHISIKTIQRLCALISLEIYREYDKKPKNALMKYSN